MLVGYKLIHSPTDTEVNAWGGVYGQCPGIPNPLLLPTGDQICGAVIGVDYGEYRLDEWVAPPTAIQIKQEAQRRIIALTGAADFNTCIVKQLNALMRVGELNNKLALGGTLTELEFAEATSLQSLADTIKELRAISDEIEALDPIPDDYASDERWEA